MRSLGSGQRAGELARFGVPEGDAVAAGDCWYDLADSAASAYKAGLQIRAHDWYVKAVPSQSGITKTRLEKRIAEIVEMIRNLLETPIR